jgi:hypothetical protein
LHTMIALRCETPMGNNLCRLQWVKLLFESDLIYAIAKCSQMSQRCL